MVNRCITLPLGPVERAAATGGEPSPRALEVAAMFGLGADVGRTVAVLPAATLRLGPGRVVFVTGASGGGKSTLLHALHAAVQAQPGVAVLDFTDRHDPPEPPAQGRVRSGSAVIDRVDDGRLPLDRVLAILALAGLNDAFVMLRRPGELSDGQRYRFRLARAMARVEADTASASASGEAATCGGPRWWVVLADEFGATLDRTTAAALARNVRRWVARSGQVCFVAATTHDDLLEPLAPDVLVEKRLGAGMEVWEVGDEN
jgi:ABC-type ATPase with predicted acetyltransferase domain